MRISNLQNTNITSNLGRMNFGNSEKKTDKMQVMEDVTNVVNNLKNENISDDRKAEQLTKLGDKITKNMNPASPLKTVVATGAMTGAGFLLGRKTLGPKVLSLLDKNTKVLDFLAKKLGGLMTKMKAVQPSEAKTFKGLMSRLNATVVKGFESFATKGLKAEELAKMSAADKFVSITKNGTTKTISTLGGVAGGTTAAAEVLKDKDGDGQSDALEKANKLSTIEKMDKFLNAAEAFTGLAS